jgi:hypothetical protein
MRPCMGGAGAGGAGSPGWVLASCLAALRIRTSRGSQTTHGRCPTRPMTPTGLLPAVLRHEGRVLTHRPGDLVFSPWCDVDCFLLGLRPD